MLPVVLCRLYTGIHALKRRPRFKLGAISESTTALNIDQTNTSNVNTDQKSPAAAPVAMSTLPSTTATCLTTTGGNPQEQQTASTEIRVSGSVTGVPAAAQKKEAGPAKAQADKKKVDARKKSLKRL